MYEMIDTIKIENVNRIIDHCIAGLLNDNNNIKSLSVSDFDSRYFSTVFKVKINRNYSNNNNNSKSELLNNLFIKIPKTEMERNLKYIPISKNNILSINEYKAYQKLNNEWPNYFTKYIKLLSFCKDHGVLILDFIKGIQLDEKLRTEYKRKKYYEKIFYNLGIELAQYHSKSLIYNTYEKNSMIVKLKIIEKDISSFGNIYSKALNDIIRDIECKLSGYNVLPESLCIKGFEIRNTMVTNNNDIYLFDPGKIKTDCIYSDIARFLVSCKMIYWGYTGFIYNRNKYRYLENKFINGYNHIKKIDYKILNIFIIRELLKQLRISLKIVSIKDNIPKAIKTLIMKHYVYKIFIKMIYSQKKYI